MAIYTKENAYIVLSSRRVLRRCCVSRPLRPFCFAAETTKVMSAGLPCCRYAPTFEAGLAIHSEMIVYHFLSCI